MLSTFAGRSTREALVVQYCQCCLCLQVSPVASRMVETLSNFYILYGNGDCLGLQN